MKKLIGFLSILTIMVAGCKKDKQAVVATLTTNSVTSVTATTASAGGDISNLGGSSLTSKGVCWAVHTNPTIADSIKYGSGGGTGAFNLSLTGLNANTVYYVRAFAINGTGTAYGNQVTFTTSAGLATLTTTPIGTINPTAASGQSGGTIVNNGGATITASGVCWSTTANPTINNSLTADNATSGTYTSTLTPLLSTTTYYYRAYATNSYGTAYGNQLSFTTSSTNTVVDVDGNVYYTVTIGTQTWMTSNLRVTHYQNGDPITNGLTSIKGIDNMTTGAFSFPNGDTTQNKTYGKLYNQSAVNDTREIAPKGWHIPSDAEWETLEFNEGMAASDTSMLNNRGTIGAKLIVGGTSGLNLQYGGLEFSGGYYYFGTQGYYYSSTFVETGINYYRAFNESGSTGPIYRNYSDYGMSIRCVKN